MTWLFALVLAFAQTQAAATAGPKPGQIDVTIAPGANFDKAEFRLWIPPDVAALKGIVVLVPGSNGDGRAQVDDEFWRAFAAKQQVALIGCRLTDKPHEHPRVAFLPCHPHHRKT